MTENSIFRIVAVQFIASVLIATTVAIFAGITTAASGWESSLSALLGGLSVTLPSAYMAWRVSRPTALPGVALMRMVSGEIGKWLITGLMIGAVFVWVESLAVGFFFLGLVAVYVCGLVAALLIAKRSDSTWTWKPVDSKR